MTSGSETFPIGRAFRNRMIRIGLLRLPRHAPSILLRGIGDDGKRWRAHFERRVGLHARRNGESEPKQPEKRKDFVHQVSRSFSTPVSGYPGQSPDPRVRAPRSIPRACLPLCFGATGQEFEHWKRCSSSRFLRYSNSQPLWRSSRRCRLRLPSLCTTCWYPARN